MLSNEGTKLRNWIFCQASAWSIDSNKRLSNSVKAILRNKIVIVIKLDKVKTEPFFCQFQLLEDKDAQKCYGQPVFYRLIS